MELQLINLGRNKVNKTITVKNEKAMFREISSHLMSNSIELSKTETENEYDVLVGGFRNVGKIILKSK